MTDVTERGAALSRAEKQFIDAIKSGLHGDGARMQQTLRRVLRARPEFLAAQNFYEAVLSATVTATPPLQGPPGGVGRQLLADSTARSANRVVDGTSLSMRGSGQRTSEMIAVPGALDLSPSESVPEPALPEMVRMDLAHVISEHQMMAEAAPVPPTRTVLFTGEPGTGKSMTARWVAATIGKPMAVLDLAYVMSHELGRSAHNLREALEWAATNDVVLFVDEFDAIASRRGASNDVGEMRRLVNVLLLALDDWPVGHLLLAATNHPELLDRAIERRFEMSLVLPLPDAAARFAVAQAALPSLSDAGLRAAAALTAGMSGSDVSRAMLRATRVSAHEGRTVDVKDVLAATHARPAELSRVDRDVVIRALHDLGWSSRQIADLVAVTHPTVLSALKTDADEETPIAARD